MTQLVTSGYLDRLGFDFKPARPEDMFRRPHAVVDAYLKAGQPLPVSASVSTF